MSGLKAAVAISLGLAVTALVAAPADAATVRRHVTCMAIYLVITAPIAGTTNSSSVDIKNNLSFTIPAGTLFTYTIPGHQRTYQASSALAPGQVLAIPDSGISVSGACDASFPDTRFGATNITKLNSKGLTLQRSP